MRLPDAAAGRILTRRQALALLGGAAAVALTRRVAAQDRSLPACMATPEQTEGPYFVDERLNRADIRADAPGGRPRPGTPLQLELRVSQAGRAGCTPLAGAIVDVWHCDAAGLYSGVSDAYGNTRGNTFLRGYQVTDRDGLVRFTTIYPGWYPGRAVHIHFKVRLQVAGKPHELTSQLYFDEAVTDRVHTEAPYAARGRRTLLNNRDGLYANGGERLLMTVAKSAAGYSGSHHIGLAIG